MLATDVAVGDARAEGVLRADLTDYGQATEVLRGCDAVVHLANIPAPGLATPAVTFNANTTMNFNVFHAAAALGLTRVVWASSETTLGLPFGGGAEQVPGARGRAPLRPGRRGPLPVPVDHLRPVQGRQRDRRRAGLPLVGDPVRRAAHLQHHGTRASTSGSPPTGPTRTPASGTPGATSTSATSPQACRLGLEADVAGSHNVIIAAADTVMNRPSRDLLAEVFPDIPVTGEFGEFGTLLAIGRARELLGYQPAHSWRDEIEER